MARMFNPPHPGFTLRDDVLPALGLGVSQAASMLKVSRVALSRVLNGHAGITPEFALRLEAWLGLDRGGDAAVWLAQQAEYDLWHAQQSMPTDSLPRPLQGFPELMDCLPLQTIVQTVHLVSTSKEGAASVIATASQTAASFIRFDYSAAEERSTVRISEGRN